MSAINRFSGGDTIKTGDGRDELIFVPSKEANICFSCPKKKCHPGCCRRYEAELRKLKESQKKKEN